MGTGDINDRDNLNCLTALPYGERTRCNWQKTRDLFGIGQCVRISTEGGASPVFLCVDDNGGMFWYYFSVKC